MEEQTARAEKQALTAYRQGLSETSKEAKAKAEQQQATIQTQIAQLKEQLAVEKLKVLVAPASELIKLDEAGCSVHQDAISIRQQIEGSEAAIQELIADLLRNNVCGVKRVRGEAVDGPLGRLPLDGSLVALKASEPLGTSSGVLQLCEWFRSRPSPGAQLDLSKNPETMATLLPILTSELKASKTLTSVDLLLSGNSLGADGAMAFAPALAGGSLTRCDISGNSIGDDGMHTLGQALVSSTTSKLRALKCDAFDVPPDVVSVDLSNTRMNTAAATLLAGVIKCSSSLAELSISGNIIGDDGKRALGAALQSSMQSVTCDKLDLRADATTLDLKGKGLGPGDAALLAGALRSFMASLTFLSLGRNPWGDEGVETLSMGLKENKSLTTLDLHNEFANEEYKFGPKGATALASAIAAMPSLTAVDLSSNRLSGGREFGESVKTSRVEGSFDVGEEVKYQGRKMIISHYNRGSKYDAPSIRLTADLDLSGIKAIADALRVSLSLRELSISGNLIDDDGKRALGMAFQSTMRSFTCDRFDLRADATTLDLKGKGLGSGDAALVAGALRSFMASLTVANLLSNDLDIESAKLLVEAVKSKDVSLCGIKPDQSTAVLQEKRRRIDMREDRGQFGPSDAILLLSDLSKAGVSTSLTEVRQARASQSHFHTHRSIVALLDR